MKHEFSCLGFICTCTKRDSVLGIHRERFEDLLAQSEELGFQKALNVIDEIISERFEEYGEIGAVTGLRSARAELLRYRNKHYQGANQC